MVRFMNDKTRRIARLVRILDTNLIEDIFGSQGTLSMMWPLRYHRLRLARLKKPGGKYQLAPNNGGMKYGIRVPRSANEAAQFNKENCNFLWDNAILKKLETLMYMKVFKKLT